MSRTTGNPAGSVSPFRSIRKFCVACTGSSDKVRKCTGQACWLFPLRLGKRASVDRSTTGNGAPYNCTRPAGTVKTPLPHIRKHCLDCMGGSYDLVGECSNERCHLHPYRLGKHPRLTGRKRTAGQKAAANRLKAARK